MKVMILVFYWIFWELPFQILQCLRGESNNQFQHKHNCGAHRQGVYINNWRLSFLKKIIHKCLVSNPLHRSHFPFTAPLFHTLLALLAHQMSVYAPIPLGKAVNPLFSNQHLQTINLLCKPCDLLNPEGSGEVNAMLIPGTTFCSPWESCLTSSRCQLCPHCRVTPFGIYNTSYKAVHQWTPVFGPKKPHYLLDNNPHF